jgi:P4 family phage/plasmid primase-like protien
MSIWSRLKEFAELYIEDPGAFHEQAKPLVEAERESYTRFENDAKKLAKKIEKSRQQAQRESKREESKAERQARQEAAASVGAPHMNLGSPAEVARLLLANMSAQHSHAPAYDEGSVWAYNRATGAWAPIRDGVLMHTVQSWDGVSTVGAEAKPWACTNSETPIKMLKNDLDGLGAGPGYFKGRQVGIAFADGFLGIENKAVVVKKNKPDNRCRFALPFSIRNAKVQGSKFEQMQVQQFGSLQDPRCLLLWEYAGIVLLGLATEWNKCLILFGPGGTGKGTTVRILSACFPPSAVTTIQPQKWTHGPSLDNLAHARLNAVNEMNTDDLSDVGRFKAVISGDNIDAEAKYKAPYTFAPSAGHIFTVNPGQLPTVPEADGPFWDRFLCVPFERVFRDTDEQNRGLADEIIAEEIHIVVAHAISCAVAAIKRGKFTKCDAGEAVLSEWKDGVNPLSQFLAERTAPFEGSSARQAPSLGDVFGPYQKWCEEAGHKSSSRTVLGRRLRAMGLMELSNGNRVLVRLLQRHEYSDDSSPI